MIVLKRLILFAALGPFLGFVFFFWLALPVLNLSDGGDANIDIHQVVLLPLAYAVGVLPALLTGIVDHLMLKRAWRPFWTFLSGYFFGFLPILTSLFAGFTKGPFVLLFGLVGALPALVCSLIASRIPKKRAG